MKKIVLLLMISHIVCNFTFATESPASERKKKITRVVEKIQKSKKRILVQSACDIAYENQSNTLANQAATGVSNCNLSNQIIENFNLQGCISTVNQTYLLGMNSNFIGYAVCVYLFPW